MPRYQTLPDRLTSPPGFVRSLSPLLPRRRQAACITITPDFFTHKTAASHVRRPYASLQGEGYTPVLAFRHGIRRCAGYHGSFGGSGCRHEDLASFADSLEETFRQVASSVSIPGCRQRVRYRPFDGQSFHIMLNVTCSTGVASSSVSLVFRVERI
jgi:hypothetical protein